MLYPTISSNAWESGIATRIVLFRDWPLNKSQTSSEGKNQPSIRLASVTKAKNISYEGLGRLATLRLAGSGFEEMQFTTVEIKNHMSPAPPPASLKRQHAEVADSESEDGEVASDNEFGWDSDENTLGTGDLVG